MCVSMGPIVEGVSRLFRVAVTLPLLVLDVSRSVSAWVNVNLVWSRLVRACRGGAHTFMVERVFDSIVGWVSAP
ncbi:hypothetical protein FRAHR75_1490010 [Frankia sp. Hr75.2]|nr:hypothetical protein FRAHR75_1490010 [Frankia sp. Hr75.2]